MLEGKDLRGKKKSKGRRRQTRGERSGESTKTPPPIGMGTADHGIRGTGPRVTNRGTVDFLERKCLSARFLYDARPRENNPRNRNKEKEDKARRKISLSQNRED